MQINKFIKSKLSSKFTFLLLYLDITKKEKYMLLVVIILNLLSSYLSLNSFFLLSFREFSSTGEHSLIIMHPLDLTTPSLVVGGCCNTNFPPPSNSYYYSGYPGTVFLSLYYFVCMKYVSLNLPQKQWLVHNLSFACGVFEYQNMFLL